MRIVNYSDQSDPKRNRHFSRRWTQQPMTAAQLEHAADLELAQGNSRRADLLSWAAHAARTRQEARP